MWSSRVCLLGLVCFVKGQGHQGHAHPKKEGIAIAERGQVDHHKHPQRVGANHGHIALWCGLNCGDWLRLGSTKLVAHANRQAKENGREPGMNIAHG